MAFYNKLLDTDLKMVDVGPNQMVMFPTSDKNGVAGHLYPGKPAPEGTGPAIHLVAPTALKKHL